MGITVWAMIELEADDALASAAAIASQDSRVNKYAFGRRIKISHNACDEDRIVQIDRRSKVVRDADGVRAKFGVDPELIPDYLALVGDSADGYPGIAGIGPKGAAALLTRYGTIEQFPAQNSASGRLSRCCSRNSQRFEPMPTLFADVSELEWRGPLQNFPPFASGSAPPISSRALRNMASAEVTFAFTDIEGSTVRGARPRHMQDAVRRHDAIMRAAIAQQGGHVFKTAGDAFYSTFAAPQDAVAAMLAAQRALNAEDFSAVGGLRVRAAINTGAADRREDDYFGPALNKVARVLAIGHGGQVLLPPRRLRSSTARWRPKSGYAISALIISRI